MSYEPGTVHAMLASYLVSGILPRLPLFLVLIIGVVLVARARAKVGARSATLAHLGLGALFLDLIAGLIWAFALPQVYRSFDSSMSFNVVNTLIALVQSILMTVGVALLVAAVVVTRTAPGGGRPAGPAYGMPVPAAPGPGYPAGPYSPIQPAGTNPPGQPQYPMSGAPTGTNPPSQPYYPTPAQPAVTNPTGQPQYPMSGGAPSGTSATGEPHYPTPGAGDSTFNRPT